MKLYVKANNNMQNECIIEVEVLFDVNMMNKFDTIAAARDSKILDIPYDPEWSQEKYDMILEDVTHALHEAIAAFDELYNEILNYIKLNGTELSQFSSDNSPSKYVYFSKDNRPQSYLFQISISTHQLRGKVKAHAEDLMRRSFHRIKSDFLKAGNPIGNALVHRNQRRFIINSKQTRYKTYAQAYKYIIDWIDSL